MAEQGKRIDQNTGEKPVKKKKQKKKRHIILRIIGFIFRFIMTIILIAMTTGALLACFGAVYIKTVIMPQTELDLSNFFVNQNSVMHHTDAYDNVVETVTLLNTESSIWKDYHEIPQDLIRATVAIEDKRFWEHPGVDWRRTGAAVIYMFTGQDIQGGSTLTQQLIKNLTTEDDVTVKRKVIEIFRALELDRNYSKYDIITWYLNKIYLGEGNRGVGAASLEYFGKDVSELSLAECASLISITNNPSIFSPYGTYVSPHPETGEMLTSLEWNKYRQEVVLWAMLEQEMISRSEYESAKNEELVFVRSAEEEEETTIYTWFEEQVIKDVREDLMETYGYSAAAANMMLSSGGLSIYTTLDQGVQSYADVIYQDWGNLNQTSSSGQALQSAITIIDNSTGDVVAMVGQMGTKEKNLLKNFATEANRQPGSAIKPLSAYAPALDSGVLTPVSVVDDYPYQLINNSAWPINAYGYYRGMTGLEFGLEQSSNCMAVRVVGDLLTPDVSFDYMTNVLHFDLVESMDVYGQIMSDKSVAPLALGGLTQGVNTRDMAEGYATFANSGIYTHSRTYTKVLDSNGNVLLDNSPRKEIAMKTTTAYYINDLLEGVLTSSGATALRANFDGMTIAGKTGTTNDQYDLWFVGYTPYYTAAVWTGYEYNEKINTASAPAMSMWKMVMEPLHEGLADIGFNTPDGLTSVSYCMDSGCLPSSYCYSDVRGSRVASKMIYPQDAPTETCSAHGPGGAISICTQSAVMNADGEMSGYQLAGAFCPDYAISTQSYVVLDRVVIAGASARDSSYVYSGSWRGTCSVHTAGYVYDDLFTDIFPDYGYDVPSVDDSNNGGESSGDSSNSGDNSGTTTTPTVPEDTTPTTPTTPTEPDDSGGIPGVTVPTTPTVPDTTVPDTTPTVPDVVPDTTPTVPDVVVPSVPDVVVPDSTTIPGVSTGIPGVG